MATVRVSLKVRLAAGAAAMVVAVAGFATWSRGGIELAAPAKGCPPGFVSYAELEAGEHFGESDNSSPDLGRRGLAHEDGLCVLQKHPESYAELAAFDGQRSAMEFAPAPGVREGARTSAARRAESLSRGRPGSMAHRWRPVGAGPLQSADTYKDGEGQEQPYSPSVLGLVELEGRITDFSYDPLHGVLYASVAYGGVWKSTDQGKHWQSIGDDLPTTTVGSVAFSEAAGGTIVVLTGDGSYGSSSHQGMGAYWRKLGTNRWHRADGVPSAAFGFNLAVDSSDQKVIYAATGVGLFRSTDAGRSFKNVRLPTGKCAGKSNTAPGCIFANMVTDVVVKERGGSTDEKGGEVVAAVGWRGGNAKNPDGSIQSPNNGIYSSPEGVPGSFTKVQAMGFAPQDQIGRTELGAAIGPEQNHNYLYAIVQDAVKMRNGVPGIDAPETNGALDLPTVLNGIYVSPDFGTTWILMADAAELMEPQTGSALPLVATPALGSYGPGVQAWYNMFIQPDPSRTDPLGAPTRLLFGLEEVWQNEETHTPQIGKSQFKVIGRYFSGETCLFLSGIPACPTDREDALEETTTTHPDQHAVAFIPNEDGVTLVVGNDGGVYTQRVGADEEFTNAKWGIGDNRGFNTLMPYHATRATDGTVWMGLQDNGTAIINPKTGRQTMVFGGDGFFVGVDPHDSMTAYAETPGGDMRATVDGGRTWSGMAPPITGAQFSNPYIVDPQDANHLYTAGREVVETASGPGTSADDWVKLFDLGTAKHPGDAGAEAGADDPANAMSAITARGPAAYVGFCGVCDVLNNPSPFRNGIATNVGGGSPPRRYTSKGWHFAPAKGLPNRYITSIAMDPKDRETIYVTLGGYSRRWTPPGSLDAETMKGIGKGHLYRSTSAGKTFEDVSFNLPDAPATWVTMRGKQLLVGTDVGIFASRPDRQCLQGAASSGCDVYAKLGTGLPNAPISTVEVAPDDPNLVTLATWGRGVYEYRFGPKPAGDTNEPEKPLPPPKHLGKAVAGPFGFELDEEGWTVKPGTTMAWTRGPDGHASTQSFQVVPYTNEESTSLVSPAFKLPERSLVEVAFWNRRDLEPDFDYLTVDWSSDGHLWQPAGSFTGNNAGYPDYGEEVFSFVAPAGKLYLRFRVTSDQLISSPPYLGIWLDDISISR